MTTIFEYVDIVDTGRTNDQRFRVRVKAMYRLAFPARDLDTEATMLAISLNGAWPEKPLDPFDLPYRLELPEDPADAG